ncbi:MAG TPA: hypothetical protein VFX02_04070 [Gammaproteobacteria bacterium]|nr:hypothetical protein [Gammaproteobacteria bacterium]
MRHSILIMLVGCTIALFLVLQNCASSEATIERASADGRIRLSIPKNSLPRGVKPADISIVALNPAAVPIVTGLGRPRFAYRLEPQGISFSRPVKLTMNTAGWPLRQLPMLLHRSPKSLEALNLKMTLTGKRLDSVSSELYNFSEILGFLSVMSVEITDPGDRPVGSAIYFNISAGTRPSEIDKLQTFANNSWTRQRVANPVRFSTGAFVNSHGIAPDRIGDRPDSIKLDPSIRHTEFETFECTAESAGNQISYSIHIQSTLELSGSDAPDHVVNLPLDDDLRVYTNPFACIPPQPLPEADDFSITTFDLHAQERFEVGITKRPAGRIRVGQDFTLRAEVRHTFDGEGDSHVGPDWKLKYGRFETVRAEHRAITPRRAIGMPDAATVAAQDPWQGEARFRCMTPGVTLIDYKAFVHYRWPWADGNGSIAMPVTARAKIICDADPAAAGTETVAPLPDADLIGPISHQAYNDYGAFIVRWWRRPDADNLPIGTEVEVHMEVENLRTGANVPETRGSPVPWSLYGKLYTLGGTGLEPARYDDAPGYIQAIRAHNLWNGTYKFICRNPDIAVLRHDFTIETPAMKNLPPLVLSVNDPGLSCIKQAAPGH